MDNIVCKMKRKMQRLINQSHVNDYPDVAHGWKKYEGSSVLGNLETGTMFDPFVRLVGNEYVMCVSQRKNACIKKYSSVDGIHWENEQTVLSGLEKSKWEIKVNRGCFCISDGVWHLWYTGQNGLESKIGHAISTDGNRFERCGSNPVVVPELPHEGNSVMNPCVMWDLDRNVYKMWYAAGENYEPDVICYAESEDGICWSKMNEPVMQANKNVLYKQYKVGACDVVKSNEKYIMAYIAYQNLDVARIALAVSPDGIHQWKDLFKEPIIGPSKGRWDGHAVYKPALCLDGKRKYLWYNGRCGTTEKIGLAMCEEEK